MSAVEHKSKLMLVKKIRRRKRRRTCKSHRRRVGEKI